MKKKLVGLLVCMLVLTSLPMITAAKNEPTTSRVSEDTDWWPMYAHDPARTGVSTSTAAFGLGTSETVYTTPVDIRSSLAIVNDNIYFGSANTLYSVKTTGEINWTFTTGDQISSTPAVDNGRVYVGSYDNKLYCINQTTRTAEWNYTTGNDILSSPTVVNDRVYFGSMDKKIYCFDADPSDGVDEGVPNPGKSYDKIWQVTTNGLGIITSPAVADGRVFISSTDNLVYCLDANDGTILWLYPTDTWALTPTVVDNKVYVATAGTLYCLDAVGNPETGETTCYWSKNIFPSMNAPVVANGKVYTSTYIGTTHKFSCLNAETGDFIWNYTIGSFSGATSSFANGHIYFTTSDRLYCANAETGTILDTYYFGGSYSSVTTPTIIDANIYIGFGTHVIKLVSDQPPSKPTLTGPSQGLQGKTLNFVMISTDPEGATLNYGIDYLNNDSVADTWSGWQQSGQPFTWHHAFEQTGTYVVRAMCYANGHQNNPSEWSDPLTVVIYNNAPATPHQPSGPAIAFIGKEVAYTTWSTDPDGSNLKYRWDWNGDGYYDEETNAVPSGYNVTTKHTFDAAGVYNVTVKATDGYLESDWSQPLQVTVYNTSLEITSIAFGKGEMNVSVKNNGTLPTDATWSVVIEGGLFFITNRTDNGITEIQAGDTSNFTMPITGLGLGIIKPKPTITIQVLSPDVPSVEVTKTVRVIWKTIILIEG